MHPISRALLDEAVGAFRERRQAVEMDVTLSRFPICEVEQWRRQNKREEEALAVEREKQAAQKVQRRIKARLAGCLIPPLYADTRFGSLHPSHNPDAFRACQTLAETGRYQDRVGILLTGAPGNGKTSLAVAALGRFVDRTLGLWPARFFNLNRGLQAVRESFDGDRENTSILDLCGVSFLRSDGSSSPATSPRGSSSASWRTRWPRG